MYAGMDNGSRISESECVGTVYINGTTNSGEKKSFKKLPESNFKSTGNYKGSTGKFLKENDYQAFDVLLFHRVVNIDTGKSPVSLLYSLIKLFKKKQSKCLYGKLNEINTRSRKD